jgi:ABC-type lipoprotein export system ATPase subunit
VLADGRQGISTRPPAVISGAARIHRARGTIILVTHDAELAAIADSRLILRDGRVVEHES